MNDLVCARGVLAPLFAVRRVARRCDATLVPSVIPGKLLNALQFIVMFRSRFSDAFPKNLAHFGPQELERDVVESVPGDRVEHFLCALLGLLLNRKQDVKCVRATRATYAAYC